MQELAKTTSGQLTVGLSRQNFLERIEKRGVTLATRSPGAIVEFSRTEEGYAQVIGTIAAELISIMKYFGQMLDASEAHRMAATVLENYPTMTPEDITIFFSGARAGVIKSPKKTIKLKTYGQVTPFAIMGWLEEFQEAVIDSVEYAREMDKKDSHNAFIRMMHQDQFRDALENFATTAKEAEAKREMMLEKEKQGEAYRISRIRGLALDTFHESAELWEHELMWIVTGDEKSKEKMKSYWETTPAEDQIRYWAPILARWTDYGMTHLYLYHGVHKKPMFMAIWNMMTQEDQNEVIASAISSWKARLVDNGQNPIGDTFKAILASLDKDKAIPAYETHTRIEMIKWWITNKD